MNPLPSREFTWTSSLIFSFVVLLFYIHHKHLRSCRDGQLTWTLFLGRLRPPKRLTSTSCTYLFSLKNNEKIFMNVLSCSRDWCDWRLRANDNFPTKGHHFVKTESFVTVLLLCTSSDGAVYLYKITWIFNSFPDVEHKSLSLMVLKKEVAIDSQLKYMDLAGDSQLNIWMVYGQKKTIKK